MTSLFSVHLSDSMASLYVRPSLFRVASM